MTTPRSKAADDERPAAGRLLLGIWMLAALLAPGARAANCNAIKVWSFNVRFDDNGPARAASRIARTSGSKAGPPPPVATSPERS